MLNMLSSCRKHIHDAMPKTWQAACWSLERRYPEEYGRFGMPLGELNEANAVESCQEKQRTIHRPRQKQKKRKNGLLSFPCFVDPHDRCQIYPVDCR